MLFLTRSLTCLPAPACLRVLEMESTLDTIKEIIFASHEDNRLLAIVPLVAVVAVPSAIYALRCVSLSFDKWYLYRSTYVKTAALFYLTPLGRGLVRLVGCRGSIAPNGDEATVEVEWVRRAIAAEQRKPDSLWSRNDLPEASSIRSVSIARDGLKGGFVGEMFKILVYTDQYPDTRLAAELETDAADAPEPTPATTLVVKTIRRDLGRRFSAALLGTAREAFFYRDFASSPELTDLRLTPRTLYADGSRAAGSFTVVMEDLSKKAVLASQLLGHQCWGPPPPLPTTMTNAVPQPEHVIEAAFVQYAQVHARFWRRGELLDMPWLKHVDWLLGRDRARWELAMDGMHTRWSTILEHAAESKVVWPNEVVAMTHEALNNTSWAAFHERFDVSKPDTPFTLCHGDFHAGNMFWAHSSNDVYSVDFAEVGVFCPFTELAQYLVSNATVALRREHEQRLFRLYYDRLIAEGVSPELFPYDQCWERYKLGGIERWLQMLIIMGAIHALMPNGMPGFAMDFFIEQTRAFIEDHGSTLKKPIMFMTGYCIA